MKKRVITGAVITLIAVPLILIGKWPFDIGVLLLLTGAAFEFVNIKKCHVATKAVFTALVGVECLLTYLTLHADVIFGLYSVWGLTILLSILFGFGAYIFDKGEETIDETVKGPTLPKRNGGVSEHDVFLFISMSIFYTIVCTGMLLLNLSGPNKYRLFLIALLVLPTIACDIGAFLIGSKFGKHKLIPGVSPNKTIEGALGGYILGLIAGGVLLVVFNDYFTVNLLIAAIVLPFTCQVGDLFFSFIKRSHKVKDFSNLLPGHGGLNDRVDSLMLNTIVLLVIRMF